MRNKLIVGNWKMNGNKTDICKFLQKLEAASINDCNVIVCLPYVYLNMANDIIKKSSIILGAQNCCFEENDGAYTGEVSAKMLKDIGVKAVIVGHSERRIYFNEDSAVVGKKLKAAANNKLAAILCVGEQKQEYLKKIGKNVVEVQTRIGLSSLDKEQVNNLTIAYEPVWAIGSNSVASREYIEEMVLNIRQTIASIYDKKIAEQIQVLYGGAVNKHSIVELSKIVDIDGFLVGRASLYAEEFLDLINLCYAVVA